MVTGPRSEENPYRQLDLQLARSGSQFTAPRLNYSLVSRPI
jgi:hypothetical protein